MEEFIEFKEEVLHIAKAREKIQIKQQLQKLGVLPEDEEDQKPVDVAPGSEYLAFCDIINAVENDIKDE